jgi:hypothetical protein
MIIIIVALLFIVLGLLIKYGKMYFLIAGYNTMSAEKKAKYDIEGIAEVFKNAMFGMGFLMIIGVLIAARLEQPNIEYIGMFVALLIGLPYLLIKVNSKQYKI